MAQSDFEQESTANATWSRMLQGNRRFAEDKPPARAVAHHITIGGGKRLKINNSRKDR